MEKNTRIKTTILWIMLAAFLLAFTGLCWAIEFSGDMSTKVSIGASQQSPAQNMQSDGKLYIKGNKIRQDVKSNLMNVITIARGDKKVRWTLNPKDKTYMELSTSNRPDAADPLKSMSIDGMVKQMGGPDRVTKKLLGKETVNGFACTKYQIMSKIKNAGVSSTIWIADKINFPIRVFSQSQGNKVTLEVKNIRIGKVADSIFEIPKGYKKMEMPRMPQGMGGMPRQGGPGRPGMPGPR
jgi:hypothetical protein